MLALGLAFTLATNAAALLGPWVLKLAVDDLSFAADAGHPLERATLVQYFWLIVAVAALVGGCRFLMRRVLIGLSREIEYDLRNDLFAHLTTLDAPYYARTPTGDLMNRLVNDLSAVRMVLGPGIMNLANTAVLLVAATALLLAIDVKLTLVALAPMLLLTLAENLLGSRLHRRYTAAQEELSRLSSLTQENVSGIRVVKAYAQEASEIARFEARARELVRLNLATARVSAVFHPLMALLAGMSLALVLLYGGRAVVAGTLSLGTFVAFQAYLALLVWPMIALGWVLNLFERGASSMRRLEEVLDARPAVRDPESPRLPAAAITGELEAREVSFRYAPDRPLVLDSVSFRVPAGGSLGIIGSVGSGKSTLAALLLRLYDPSGGEIRLDSVPLRELPLQVLRAAVGFVPQETVLFSDTIRANLAFAPEPHGDDEVARAAAAARLEGEIAGFPHGYQTRVGERGVTLSGGQKQRVAIARALLLAPSVLVLDDALSAVDAETEDLVLASLRDAARGRTSVVVSHRISAVRGADEILVLDGGRVAERGRHAELVARGGLYASLFRRQRLEAELERT